MKILIVTLGIPPFVGGAENVAWDLAHHLKDQAEIALLCGGDLDKIQMIDGMKVIMVKRRFPYTLHFELLRKRLEEVASGFDVVNVHGTLPFGYALRKAKAKKIITCHGMEREDWSMEGIFNSLFIPAAIRAADAVTAPGKGFSQYLQKRYRIPVRTIPNGIDLKLFQDLGKKREPKSVLFAGRFAKIKGIAMLRQVAGLMPDHNFTCIGEGPLADMLFANNITILPKMDRKQLVQEYNKHESCLFPSVSENFPLAALEAKACGCRVVASGAFADVLEDGVDGLIVSRYEATEFRDAIKRARKMTGLPMKARSSVKRFGWEEVSGEYLRLFSSV